MKTVTNTVKSQKSILAANKCKLFIKRFLYLIMPLLYVYKLNDICISQIDKKL